jgi:hypothetical protein
MGGQPGLGHSLNPFAKRYGVGYLIPLGILRWPPGYLGAARGEFGDFKAASLINQLLNDTQ